MVDAKTWIDVADNAVKIGTGALVGGGFAIWRAHLSNRNKAKKSLLDKKREMIEKVLVEVDDFYALATVYWARLDNALDKRNGGHELTSTEAHDLEVLEQQLLEGFKTFGYSSSRLLIIGERDVEKALRRMRNTVDAFFQIGNVDDPKCTGEALESHRVLIQTARGAFFEALGIAFRNAE